MLTHESAQGTSGLMFVVSGWMSCGTKYNGNADKKTGLQQGKPGEQNDRIKWPLQTDCD
jgi:hypothetical protein